MLFSLFLLVGFTLTISIILLYISIIIFKKYDILDNPKKYGKKRSPIPYGVGIVFFIVFLVTSALFLDVSQKLLLIWFFGGLVTLVSFFDDRYNVSPKFRLLMQISIGAIIGLTSIKIGYVSNIFGGVIELENIFITLFDYNIYIIPIVFTIFWYVFIFNALNWTDGIKGNTSILSSVCFLVIFLLGCKLYFTDTYLAGVENAEFIMRLALILLGTLIVFTFFDIREKVLMGDAGTMFLGFMLATLAIISGGKVATVLAVFGIYAVDAIYVVIRRLIAGKNPLKGDFSHLHHRLLDIGLSETQVLVLVSGLSFIFGFAALFLETLGKLLVFCIIIIFVLGLSYIGEHVKKITFKK